MRVSRLPTVFLALTALVAWALPARALTPGTLDPAFGRGGRVTALSRGGVGYAVLIDPQSRAVTAGYTLNGRPDFVVARFLQNGTMDTTFGDLGRTILDLGGADYAYAMAFQPDGKIILAGESDSAGKSKMAIARFNSNGNVDTTFGGGDGFVLTSFGNDQQAANAVVVTPGGKIVVAGYTSSGTNARSAMVRYGSGGRLDRSFGETGEPPSTSAPAMSSSRRSRGTAPTTFSPGTRRSTSRRDSPSRALRTAGGGTRTSVRTASP